MRPNGFGVVKRGEKPQQPSLPLVGRHLRPGALVGSRWEIVREISASSHVVRYLATHANVPGAWATVLVPRAPFRGSAEVLAHGRVDMDGHMGPVQAEREALARLGHPGIPSVLFASEDRGDDLLVLDANPLRGDLRRLMSHGEAADALSTLHACWSALIASHDAGVIHRNISLQSVWLSDDPGLGQVRPQLVGFEHATVAGRGSRNMPAESAYQAPEDFLGMSRGSWATSADVSADLFSFGLVCLSVLSRVELQHGDRACQSDFIRRYLPLLRGWPVPQELVRTLRKLLDPEPQVRRAASRDFGHALETSAKSRETCPAYVPDIAENIRPEFPSRQEVAPVDELSDTWTPRQAVDLRVSRDIGNLLLRMPMVGDQPEWDEARACVAWATFIAGDSKLARMFLQPVVARATPRLLLLAADALSALSDAEQEQARATWEKWTPQALELPELFDFEALRVSGILGHWPLVVDLALKLARKSGPRAHTEIRELLTAIVARQLDLMRQSTTYSRGEDAAWVVSVLSAILAGNTERAEDLAASGPASLPPDIASIPLGAVHSDSVPELWHPGWQALLSGAPGEALAIAHRHLSELPHATSGWMLAATSLAALARWDESVDIALNILKSEPANLQAWIICLDGAEKAARAIPNWLVNHAVRRFPDAEEIVVPATKIMARGDRHTDAIAVLDRLLAHKPWSTAGWLAFAEMAENTNDYAIAHAAIDRVLLSRFADSDQTERAVAFVARAGRLPTLALWFETENNPSISALEIAARAFVGFGADDLATTAAASILTRNPGNQTALEILLDVCVRRGRWSDALSFTPQLFDVGVSIDSQMKMALAYLETGDLDSARRLMDLHLERPEVDAAISTLGLALLGLDTSASNIPLSLSLRLALVVECARHRQWAKVFHWAEALRLCLAPQDANAFTRRFSFWLNAIQPQPL
jgi:serine/threonine protein kinase/predicted Zn-dependent protease